MERQLIADYEALLEKIVAELDASRLALAVELTGLPSEIRGFGPVKQRAFDRAQRQRCELMAAWEASVEAGGRLSD